MNTMRVDPVLPLVGWGAIAEYFGRSVKTIHRWHQKKPMPICNLPNGLPAVYCDQLRRWVEIQDEIEDNCEL